MSKEVKVTKEELDNIKNIQISYAKIRDNFGGICLSKISLRNQIDELDQLEIKLDSDYKKIQGDERNFLNELNKKYGEGNLDLETGAFIPTKSK